MAATILHKDGKASETGVTIGGSQTISHLISGPPPSGYPNRKGIYILQSGSGANGTYRFLEEVWTPGTASPAAGTYTFI